MCWHSNAYFSLFSSLFFFDFHRTNFPDSTGFTEFRSCWLCNFRYLFLRSATMSTLRAGRDCYLNRKDDSRRIAAHMRDLITARVSEASIVARVTRLFGGDVFICLRPMQSPLAADEILRSGEPERFRFCETMHPELPLQGDNRSFRRLQ
jgi:hypothetical protein